MSKVPEVTLYFWIIKVLCTTVGETAADYLNVSLNLGLTGTSGATGALLVIALAVQFSASRYVPSRYWLTVTLVSVFGTLVTDNLTTAAGLAASSPSPDNHRVRSLARRSTATSTDTAPWMRGSGIVGVGEWRLVSCGRVGPPAAGGLGVARQMLDDGEHILTEIAQTTGSGRATGIDLHRCAGGQRAAVAGRTPVMM